ncbi:hypothetical protein [Polyangium aurulentum]|uniref:hypothetical protein n=1 Tax=Polyangium aurulentum TaxID=2567896 RepID=UPI0010AE3269|nr:hypothetical protein [Polyangium aurulentum]UQA59178.1 hypothetical protein E8A73_001270 [Polyangium aurulentum]
MNTEQEDFSETVARWANTITSALDAATPLACPRIMQRMSTLPTANEIAARFAEYIATADEIQRTAPSESNRRICDAARDAATLRDAITNSGIGDPLHASIVAHARAFLIAFGYREPPEGWDAVDIPKP